MKASLIVSLVCLVALVNAQTNSLRFINAIEGTTLTLFSNKLSDQTVAYGSTTAYFPIADGTISITNVVDQNGTSYNNGVPIATSFGPYYTLVATYNASEADPTKRFILVLFNETTPAGLEAATDNTKSWIRLLDLDSATKFITLASPAGTSFSFIVYTQVTPYAIVAASTTEMRLYDSQSGSYNSPMLTVSTNLTALTAYTLVLFNRANGTRFVSLVDDKTISGSNGTSTTGNTPTISTPSIRFVNNIENSTLTIFTNDLAEFTLEYMESTEYFGDADGSLSIQNVLNQNGVSLNNGVPIASNFGPYNTLVAVMAGNTFTFVLFNETTPAGMDSANTDATKAWVRILDLDNSGRFITVASQAGAIASSVGYLVNTPFVGLAATTAQLRIYDSVSGSYNNPDITLATNFTGKTAYTLMYFQTVGGVKTAILVMDRQAGQTVNNTSTGTTGATTTTGVINTTTGTANNSTSTGASTGTGMTSGAPLTTSVSVSTTGVVVTTGSAPNNQESGSSKLVALGLVSLVALLFF